MGKAPALKCWEDKTIRDFILDKLVSRYDGEVKMMDKYGNEALTPGMQKFHKQLGAILNDLEALPFCGESGTAAIERSRNGNVKKREDGSRGKKGGGGGGKRSMSDYQKHVSVCAAPQKHGLQIEARDFTTCIGLWKEGEKMHKDFKEPEAAPEPEPEPQESSEQ